MSIPLDTWAELAALARKGGMGEGELRSCCEIWEEKYGPSWVDEAFKVLREREKQMKGRKPLNILPSGDAVEE